MFIKSFLRVARTVLQRYKAACSVINPKIVASSSRGGRGLNPKLLVSEPRHFEVEEVPG